MVNQQPSISNNRNEGSTTIPKGSTPQANGGGNGELQTSNVVDEDIVSSTRINKCVAVH